MSFLGEDFMNFMGYRNMVVEDKIEECLAAAHRGDSSISIDRGNLTDDKVHYLQKKFSEDLGRRLNRTVGLIIRILRNVQNTGFAKNPYNI